MNPEPAIARMKERDLDRERERETETEWNQEKKHDLPSETQYIKGYTVDLEMFVL